MTRTLIFDTETAGICDHKTTDHEKQPHPVQLACILVQGDNVVNMASVIINPEVKIPATASAVHGITNDVADNVGIGLRAAAGLFINFLNRADRIVAHNIDFDIIVTEALLARQLPDYDLSTYRQLPRICTMLSSTELCKLPGKYGYKWPKLEEAYKLLVDPEGFEGAHDALADVKACWKLLSKLEDGGVRLVGGKR